MDDQEQLPDIYRQSTIPAYYTGICSGLIYKESHIISDDDDEDIEMTEMLSPFEDLHPVLLHDVFGYLNSRDLRRAASVCKRWQKIAKESTLWTTFDTADIGINHVNLIQYLRVLPSHITRLKISLNDNPVKGINLPSISLLIHERCPKLKELYIQGCWLSTFSTYVGSIPTTKETLRKENIDCNRVSCGRHSSVLLLPITLRVLSFRDLPARSMPILFRLQSAKDLPNLEVLEYSVAYFTEKTTPPWLLYSCINLKELQLASSYVASGIGPLVSFMNHLKVLNLSTSCFQVEDLQKLHQCSGNLEELYLCKIDFCDKDLSFVDSTFIKLKVICLSGSKITMQSVARLFHDCRSLIKVYANSDDRSKCGVYTITWKGFAFHETSECSVIHLCKYKHM